MYFYRMPLYKKKGPSTIYLIPKAFISAALTNLEFSGALLD